MVLPSLPQELIEEIIDQFGETARSEKERVSNRHMLATLSMVAKAWRKCSQKHLFSAVAFRKDPEAQISEDDLCDMVRVFRLTKKLDIDGAWEICSQLDPMAVVSLRCFRNLESLTLTGWHFKWLNGPKQLAVCFSHLGRTLIHLTVEGTADSKSLIYLTSMFPRLRTLDISTSIPPAHDGTGGISKEGLPKTARFQGCLHLRGFHKEHEGFLAFVSSTSPRFDTIRLENCETGDGIRCWSNHPPITLSRFNCTFATRRKRGVVSPWILQAKSCTDFASSR